MVCIGKGVIGNAGNCWETVAADILGAIILVIWRKRGGGDDDYLSNALVCIGCGILLYTNGEGVDFDLLV